MIFKVSEKFKGSCVLPTLKKAIWAKMTLSISEDDLRADDIKDAVRRGILAPVDEDCDLSNLQKDKDVIIMNNTNQVLVLGGITFRPLGSVVISKESAQNASIITAAEDEIITIISDEDEAPYIIKKKVKPQMKTKKKKKKEVVKEEIEEELIEEEEEIPYIVPETGEDREVTPVAWNFQSKEMEEAQKVPKSEGFVEVDADEDEGDIEFIDKEEKDQKKKVVLKKAAKKKTNKKNAKKKASKKKTSVKTKTKKKETKAKSKKVKTLEPVGDKKLPKTEADAAIELDSRGNPIEKASDTLKHLIDSLADSPDVDFVDDEQSLNRYKQRTDMD
jgi:hypothetical protein